MCERGSPWNLLEKSFPTLTFKNGYNTHSQFLKQHLKKPDKRCKLQLVFVLMEETTSPSYKQCLGKKANVLTSEVLNQLRVKKKKKRKKHTCLVQKSAVRQSIHSFFMDLSPSPVSLFIHSTNIHIYAYIYAYQIHTYVLTHAFLHTCIYAYIDIYLCLCI